MPSFGWTITSSTKFPSKAPIKEVATSKNSPRPSSCTCTRCDWPRLRRLRCHVISRGSAGALQRVRRAGQMGASCCCSVAAIFELCSSFHEWWCAGSFKRAHYTHLPYTHLSLTEYIKLRTVFRCGYCTCLFSNLFVWRAVLQLYFSWNSCWCCRLPEDGGSLSVEGVSLLLWAHFCSCGI